MKKAAAAMAAKLSAYGSVVEMWREISR